VAIACAAGAVSTFARAQTVDVRRPFTLVVGTPVGGARAERLDAERSGRAPWALPVARLRAEWRTPLGTLVERAPLVDTRGCTYVVGTRGEVIAIGRDGAERWRVATGAEQPGPAALLSDDSVVFADAAGDAVAVRDGAVRWRVRFGPGGSGHDAASEIGHAAPLPLDDGGVVVATGRDLAALDADGRERARLALPEPSTVPLVSALGTVVVVTASGAIWSWVPGAAEATRIGAFGAPIEGGAVLADDHTLVAVTEGQMHLVAVDLLSRASKTLAVAPIGLWLGPPAVTGGLAHMLLMTASSDLAITIDRAGSEVGRTLLGLRPPALSVDGGAAALATLAGGPHTPPLVDPAGAFLFATTGGAIGVANGTSVEILSGDICEPPLGMAGRAASPVVGMAPLEPGAFVAACHAGALLAVKGAVGEGAARVTASGERRAPHL
jgi:hypothetical protein